MTRHLVHGVPAEEVNPDLEIIFRRHYQTRLEESGKEAQ